MDGLSRIYPNQREEQTTLGYGVVPGTPAEGYALTQANFPCYLAGLFSSGISGNVLTEHLGQVTITSSTGWTQPAAGRFRRNSSGTVTTAGTWPAIGDRDALLIHVGSFDPAVAGFTKLGGATPGSSLQVGSGISTSNAARTTSNTAQANATTLIDPIEASAVLLDQSTANGHIYANHWSSTEGAEGPVQESILSGDLSSTWSAFTAGSAGAAFVTNAANYYTGIFLLAFSRFPAEIVITAALEWMAQPGHEGLLYPGFYHRS